MAQYKCQCGWVDDERVKCPVCGKQTELVVELIEAPKKKTKKEK